MIIIVVHQDLITYGNQKMKRNDVIDAIAWILVEGADDNEGTPTALRILSYIEDIGMLPPPCSVKIENGKHTPTERKWDDE